MPSVEHPGTAHRRLTYERDGFTPVSCLVADVIRGNEHVTPFSSKTDLSGEYGEPEVYTGWAVETKASGTVTVLHEHRWPSSHSGKPDPYRCEHYAATTSEEN